MSSRLVGSTGKRRQFCVFIDEFHNFASDENMGVLVTEGRKFGIATTLIHVERFGQLAHNQKLMGATQAMVNKVLFQQTVNDAREFAPEFAHEADEVKTRMGGKLVISPRPVEDIWERGHPDNHVIEARDRYLWIVDLLRTRPNESYYIFDPARIETSRFNRGNLNYSYFFDWEKYRVTPDMLREGIRSLNQYLYLWMTNRPKTNKGSNPSAYTDQEVEYYCRIVESFGGLFGWRPTMEAYMPDDMKQVYIRRASEYDSRGYHSFIQEQERLNRGAEHDMQQWMRDNPSRNANDPNSPRNRYYGARPINGTELERILKENQPIPWVVADLPQNLTPSMIRTLKNHAISIGFTQGELNELIQWRPRQIISYEKQAFNQFVKSVINLDKVNVDDICSRYTAVMTVDLIEEEKLERKYVMERMLWQIQEMQYFIIMVLGGLAIELDKNPVMIPSSSHNESPHRERSQGEMIDVMTRELTSLPRFHARIKLIDGKTHKIQTRPLPPSANSVLRSRVTSNGHFWGKTREDIETEIKERQSRWERGTTPPTQSKKVR